MSRLIAAMAATEIDFHYASCSDLRSLELRALPQLKRIVVDDGKDEPYPSGSLRRVQSLELQGGSGCEMRRSAVGTGDSGAWNAVLCEHGVADAERCELGEGET